MSAAVPAARLFAKNTSAVREAGEYVLYWMIASRRTRWNFALDRAAEWARELGKPLLVFEALRVDYPWASDRLHRFVLDGMRDNAAALRGSAIAYYPYVEPRPGVARGLLAALASRASVVVTDEFPCFFLPRMVGAAASALDVRLEAVDSNGLLPLAGGGREFHRAVDFRRLLQRELPEHVADLPRRSVLTGPRLIPFQELPGEVLQRWPAADPELLDGSSDLGGLPIDHSVAPLPERGGYEAARRALQRFVTGRLDVYRKERDPPGAGESPSTSRLSAYLHFGHLSAHQVLAAVADREGWSPWSLCEGAAGRRRGWWGMSEAAEAFLDQLVTWRELGFQFCFHRADYAEYGSLPEWARKTLADHATDPRPYVYGLDPFERAATHDPIWNAAQNELRESGRIHDYLRMLWGKKILHWTRSPREALDVMVELNNRYAIDGRDPNSYSGIFWVLGRFDRAWGPEREVFGKVRYMSSRNTRRKLHLEGYLKRWGASGSDAARG